MRHIKIISFLILIFFVFKANSYSQTGEWILGEEIEGVTYPYISCADSMNAMVAAYGGNGYQRVEKTENGGKSWKTVYVDSGQLGNGLIRMVKSVSYLTPNFAIAHYDSGYVVRTTDGGKTWSRIKFAELRADVPMGGNGMISMFNERYGYLSTSNTGPDRLFGTEDGGLTWIEVNQFKGDFLNSIINNVKCLGKGKLVCALDPVKVRRSAIAVTSNGGVSWNMISEGIFDGYCGLHEFSFVDSLNGFVIGYKKDTVTKIQFPLLYRTRDGGFSWEEVNRDVKFLFKHGGTFTISFSDTLNGVMGGINDIMRTTDGGKTWVSELNDGKKYLGGAWDVSRVKGNKGIAVAISGYTMYYKLKISGVESGSEAVKGSSISISPNPASTELTVKFSGSVSNIRLSNLLGGQLPVISTEQNGSINYDISNLSSGLYFVTWKEKGINKSKKFVVQR